MPSALTCTARLAIYKIAIGTVLLAFGWPVAAAPRAQPVASGLQHPWAVAFLPQGRFLVTERPGRLRVVEADGTLRPPLQGLPEVAAGGQGGLLDVAADFDRNRTIYFCFSEPGLGTTNSTALARARLSGDLARLEDVRVIFSQKPKTSSTLHFGCRIAERRVGGQPDGTLFLTLGERFSRRDDARSWTTTTVRSCAWARTAPCPRTTPLSAGPARCPRSGASVTATRRAPRWRRTAACGCTSTAPRAATRSTCPRPAPTTAGRW